MSACFVIPWKAATAYGDPTLATLVLLVVSAAFNSGAAATPGLQSGDERERPLAPTLWLSVVFAILSLAGNWCSAEAVSRVSGPLLAVLQRCEVLVVGLMSLPFLGERVRTPFWIGTAVAGVGLVILQRPAHGSPVFAPLGVVFGLGSATAFGAMIVLTRKYIDAVRPVLLNAIRLWLSVVLWFLVAWRIPGRDEFAPGLVLYAGLAGFFGPFLSRLGALFSARHVAANTTVLASLATPALTLLLAFAWLGTLPTRQELLGGLVLLAGVAIPLAASARRASFM
jgi:drug/metabolite transporter (DMT)-like permease